ncbi:unannotated protein [freshwater metagenome]|uniref:Unannotated protein n=1 Tax=freshwater metagenome TaxID=449393 RepID=A0A6J7A666_9ZZZZ
MISGSGPMATGNETFICGARIQPASTSAGEGFAGLVSVAAAGVPRYQPSTSAMMCAPAKVYTATPRLLTGTMAWLAIVCGHAEMLRLDVRGLAVPAA